jgi:hypothetical protein
MNQLIYQPALDPFHATFRLVRLLPIIKEVGPLPKDTVRILDFYLLFPFRIAEIRLAPQHQKYKKLGSKYAHSKPYGQQPERQIIFNRMEPMHTAAFESLASCLLVEPGALDLGIVQTTENLAPEEVAARAAALNEQQSDLMEFIRLLASEYGLNGPMGLKARTELMDHRNDAL